MKYILWTKYRTEEKSTQDIMGTFLNGIAAALIDQHIIKIQSFR
jgi:hypothetical protein